MMKNASIKEMIRKQKMDANERKEHVSGGTALIPIFFCLGTSREEAAAAE